MSACQIFYDGNVQGVGFRYSVKQIARGFDVTGFVRNLRDGRVELQASGETTELSEFFRAISESELRAHIKNQTQQTVENLSGFRGFEIRHE